MAVAAITARTRRARERRRKRRSSTGSRRPPPPRPLPRRSASDGCESGRGTRRTAATPTLARNTSCRYTSRPGVPASSRDPSFSTISPWATCRWLAWGSGPVAGRAKRRTRQKAGMMMVSALPDRFAPPPPPPRPVPPDFSDAVLGVISWDSAVWSTLLGMQRSY